MQQYSKVYNCREVPPQELQPPTALQEAAFFKTRRPRVGEGRQVTIFLMLLTVYNLDSFSLFALPYRLIYAVATQNAIMFYDTQQVSKSLNKKQKLDIACRNTLTRQHLLVESRTSTTLASPTWPGVPVVISSSCRGS